MLSDANLNKTSALLCIGQCSVELRAKGGKEAGCLTDESCLEQGVSTD